MQAIRILRFSLAGILWLIAASRGSNAADERVILYPTCGYRENDEWVIPLRAWIHENRGISESLTTSIAASGNNLTSEERANFRNRIQYFLADSESRESLTLEFVDDESHEEFRIRDRAGRTPRSDANGLIEGRITLSVEKGAALLKQQKSTRGWLTLKATSTGHTGSGRVQLLEPTGLSVVSDIDDTVKITEMLAGRQTIIRNTFFRNFEAVPGMADRYREMDDAVFHYVSASPWQLYGPLSEFLFSQDAGFPEGTFHMKSVRLNLLSLDGWDDLGQLITDENANYHQKVAQIDQLIQQFPSRRFLLVGDSGEKDPEIYREIRNRFPRQIQEIWIRDVAGDAVKNKDRLEGMKIIAVDPPTATGN